MAQSPMIAIPKKSTDEVDWTGPIRAIIKQSYGENPDNYVSECSALQRCRQDAVRGAGSDLTAASLLTKYFGQLELLELRFAEIRVSFPWRDAFTSKLTTQTSMAYEKASIIYQIAATHSAISSAQNRSDPEGLKRAYYYSRTCAGMLTYINDNFLHAPSTDLSREVIKFLVGITMAQANEIFYETCVDQRKNPTLISKVAANASALYNGLCEEVKEFFGKGIFDRNWVTLLQIKAKYFMSLMHYQRSLADTAAGKHGDALSRLQVAENNAKEAHKLASSFSPYFVTTLSTTLPADTGTAILEITKNHMALCTEKKTQGQKDNDLIYNAPVPAEATLPLIDKINAVTPIPIQEVYGTPEVQKTIGPDLFAKLIPLSVHEGASVYSEEKAKIVRAEVEKADMAESEARASLASLGVKNGLGRFKEIVEGEVQEGVPPTVLAWQEDIKRREMEGGGGVEKRLAELERLKANVASKLDSINVELANESRECETMRVKFGHKWTQEPSGGLSKDVRNGLKDHKASLEAAAPSDQQVHGLWQSVKNDIGILQNASQLESLFAAAANGGAGGSLLEVEPDTTDEAEREKMRKLVNEIEERLGRINKIARERNEIIKDLKEKVQNDDVSHLLLLNKRNTGMEPTLFANELEKFRPYQTRLASANHAQQMTIQEIASLWKSLKDKGTKGKGAKRWEERERRFNELIKRFALAREGYMEVSDGAMKGIQFYRDLTSLSDSLHSKAMSFVSARTRERESLAGKLSVEMRLESPGLQAPQSPVAAPGLPPPPPRPAPAPVGGPGPTPTRSGTLDGAFASMNLGGHASHGSLGGLGGLGGLPSAPSAPPGSTSLQRPPGHAGYTSPPPVSSPYGNPSAPPPPPPTASPYGNPQPQLQQHLYQYQSQPPLQPQQASSPYPPPPQPNRQYTQSQPPAPVPAPTQPQSPPQPPVQPVQSNSMFPPPPPPAQTVDPYAGMFGAGSPFGAPSAPAPPQPTQPGPTQIGSAPSWGAPTITNANTNSNLPPPMGQPGQPSWAPSPPPPPSNQNAASWTPSPPPGVQGQYGSLQGLYQQPGPGPAPQQHMGGYPGAYGQPSHPSHSHSYSQSQSQIQPQPQPYGSAQPQSGQNPYAGSPYGQPAPPQAGYGFPPPPPPTQQNYQYPR